MRTLADAVDEAADLLVLHPHIWTQGTYGRRADGSEAELVQEAQCVCAIGACAVTMGLTHLSNAWGQLFSADVDPDLIATFNDQEGRLAAVRALRMTARELRGQEVPA